MDLLFMCKVLQIRNCLFFLFLLIIIYSLVELVASIYQPIFSPLVLLSLWKMAVCLSPLLLLRFSLYFCSCSIYLLALETLKSWWSAPVFVCPSDPLSPLSTKTCLLSWWSLLSKPPTQTHPSHRHNPLA